MKEHEKEAERIIEMFRNADYQDLSESGLKSIAILHVKEKYKEIREQLFNLKSCRVIVSGKTYLHRLDELILEEQQVKQAIENK